MAEDQEIPEANGKKEGETPAGEKKNLNRNKPNKNNAATAKKRAPEPAPQKNRSEPKAPRRPSPDVQLPLRGSGKKRKKRK
jgi:hypothetical protein